jgi:hypothetical protein
MEYFLRDGGKKEATSRTRLYSASQCVAAKSGSFEAHSAARMKPQRKLRDELQHEPEARQGCRIFYRLYRASVAACDLSRG